MVVVIASVGGIFFARRNLRLGRGDRRNAMRLALFVFGALILSWVLRLPHVAVVSLFVTAYGAALFWILYMAIEPFVRRKWPQILVSWTRLLSAEWRDPLVARDTLAGIAFGIIIVCVGIYSSFLPSPFSGIDRPITYDLGNLLGTRFAIASLLSLLLLWVFINLATVCFLVVLSVLFRSQKAAIAVQFLLMTVQVGLGSGIVAGLVFSALWFCALTRFGLIAAILITFTAVSIGNSPITLQSSAWYAPYGYLVLAIFAAIVIYAFRYSLGGRPMLATSRLDD
jgi:hypothetical protein